MSSVRFPLFPKWLRWFAVAVVLGTVAYFSPFAATPRPAGVIPVLDSYSHFHAYASLALAYATAHQRDRPYGRAALVIGGSVAVGVLVEFAQFGSSIDSSTWPICSRTRWSRCS